MTAPSFPDDLDERMHGVWTRFHNSYVVDKTTGCWVWQKCIKGGGYGNVCLQGRNYSAHRLSWLLHKGELNAENTPAYVLHRCDNRACVNPAHLFLGTHAENMADMANKGRSLVRPGEKNPFAKLTRAQVEHMCTLRKAGRTQRELAEQFGIARSHVFRILHGEAWGDT